MGVRVPPGSQVKRRIMSDKELNELFGLMEKLRKTLKGDKEASRKFLVDVGIFTKNGNLRKPYRETSKMERHGREDIG